MNVDFGQLDIELRHLGVVHSHLKPKKAEVGVVKREVQVVIETLGSAYRKIGPPG